MSNNVLKEAEKCLQCRNPRCRKGCPINTNIPEMIRLLKENETMTAAQMLFENNPLSIICSLVCDHGAQCEGHCVKGIKGDPVAISDIEHFISDACFERIHHNLPEWNGKRAAVIGAGPAGITIAPPTIINIVNTELPKLPTLYQAISVFHFRAFYSTPCFRKFSGCRHRFPLCRVPPLQAT